MRKLVILVAAVGLFASCSKETPIAPATPKVQEQQEAPVTLTGEEAGEGQIRLSLTMELDDFESVAGGFDATQEPRAVKPTINTGAAGNKLVNLRAYADENGRIHGMLYVYHTITKKVVAFNAPFRIYNDGKSIGYDGLVSGFKDGSTYKENFEYMVGQKMSNCYVTAIIGNNPKSLNFSNKGPFVISNWDDNVTLPDNFVMLKSEANPIGWRYTKGGKVHEITVKDNGRMKLTMMGYLMMLRIHNGFPQYVTRMNPTTYTNQGKNIPVYADGAGKHYRMQRPPLVVNLDLSPTLSAAQNQQLTFVIEPKTGKGRMVMTPGAVNETYFNGYFKESQIGQPDRYRFMQTKQSIELPVGRPTPGDVPAKGDVVVAMYFPQADDFGAIGYSYAPNYYDGSAFTLNDPQGRYYTIKANNKLEKSRPSSQFESSTPYSKSLENKVYYPVIKVEPQPLNTPNGVRKNYFDWYKDYTENKARWELIP